MNCLFALLALVSLHFRATFRHSIFAHATHNVFCCVRRKGREEVFQEFSAEVDSSSEGTEGKRRKLKKFMEWYVKVIHNETKVRGLGETFLLTRTIEYFFIDKLAERRKLFDYEFANYE